MRVGWVVCRGGLAGGRPDRWRRAGYFRGIGLCWISTWGWSDWCETLQLRSDFKGEIALNRRDASLIISNMIDVIVYRA